MATMGAFLVLESREHAQARGARGLARIEPVSSGRNPRQPGAIEAELRAHGKLSHPTSTTTTR